MDSVEYDKEANAFYFRLSNNKVVKTIPYGNDKFIDIDKDGKIVGMEVLNNAKLAPMEFNEVVRRTDQIKLTA